MKPVRNNQNWEVRPPKEVIEDVEKAGLIFVKAEINKHYKIHVRAPDGRTCFFVVSRSSSDHHARKNNLSIMKRFARGALNVRTPDRGQS